MRQTQKKLLYIFIMLQPWATKSRIVRTPDTDIIVILLYHAHQINLPVFFDTGHRKQKKMQNITEQAESLG